MLAINLSFNNIDYSTVRQVTYTAWVCGDVGKCAVVQALKEVIGAIAILRKYSHITDYKNRQGT